MFKKIVLILGVFILPLMAGNNAQKNIDFNKFMKELQQIQVTLNKKNVKTKTLNDEIQKIRNKNRLDKIIAESHDKDLVENKITQSAYYLFHYIKMLKNDIKHASFVEGRGFYKIGKESFIGVNKSDFDAAQKKVSTLKKELLKVRSMYNELLSVEKIADDVAMSNKVAMLLNEAKQIKNSMSNRQIYAVSSNSMDKNDIVFCSVKTGCWGYDVVSVSKEMVKINF